jgi:hypothetical protein
MRFFWFVSQRLPDCLSRKLFFGNVALLPISCLFILSFKSNSGADGHLCREVRAGEWDFGGIGDERYQPVGN